jgi:hypothetical protein
MMAEICGMTPEAIVLRRKMSAYPPSATTPSWMRAPPGEILREDISQTALDGSPACHDRVAHEFLPVQIKVVRAVLDEGI